MVLDYDFFFFVPNLQAYFSRVTALMLSILPLCRNAATHCVTYFKGIFLAIYTGRTVVNPLELTTFLPKYDRQHPQIFTHVLRVDKDNPGK